MDVLKARKRALGKKDEELSEKAKAPEEKPKRRKKKSSKKKKAETSSSKVETKVRETAVEDSDVAEKPETTPDATGVEDAPRGALAPEEIDLSEEDLRGLYKTQEMPELPEASFEEEIPEGARAPEEIELTEDDLNGLYKTQSMPELPGVDLSPDEAENLLMHSSDVDTAIPPEPVSEKEPEVETEAPVPEETKETEPKKTVVEEVGSSVPDTEKNESGGKEDESDRVPREFLSFMLGSEEYALPLARISEIIKPREVTEVPRCPEFVLGIISLRGVVIPVFDLAARLNLGEVSWDRRSRIAIVRREDGELVGLAVDSVQDVVRVLPGDIEPPPPAMGGLEAQFLEGVGRAEESRRVRIEESVEKDGADTRIKQKVGKRKLVILLNLDKVAVL